MTKDGVMIVVALIGVPIWLWNAYNFWHAAKWRAGFTAYAFAGTAAMILLALNQLFYAINHLTGAPQ